VKLLFLCLFVVYTFASSPINNSETKSTHKTIANAQTYLKYKVNLTSIEKQWLQNHKVIKIGVDSSYAPYAFFSPSGEYKGVSADITYLIAKILNIKMKSYLI